MCDITLVQRWTSLWVAAFVFSFSDQTGGFSGGSAEGRAISLARRRLLL